MTTREITRAAMAEKRKAGHRIGDIPYGWEIGADGRLSPVAREQEILSRIVECRDAGMSLRAIASLLNDRGIVTKKGKATWYAATVKSILDRAAINEQ